MICTQLLLKVRTPELSCVKLRLLFFIPEKNRQYSNFGSKFPHLSYLKKILPIIETVVII